MDNELEERYAALRERAEAMHSSELNLCLTVGGVRINELYRVRKSPADPQTISEQLDEVEQWLDDPRTIAAAKATLLMTETETFAQMIADLAKTRQEEYRVAIEAFRSISSDPPLNDEQNEVAAQMVTIARDDDKFEALLDIAKESIKAKKAQRRKQAIGNIVDTLRNQPEATETEEADTDD